MKAVFGIVSLLIVLAVVGVVATRQMQANVAAVSHAGVSGIAVSDPNAVGMREQSRVLQDQVRDQVARSVQQGADRAASADQ